MPNELAYCELFNPNFHGWDNYIFNAEDTNFIHTSYLYCFGIELNEFLEDDYIVEVRETFRPQHPIIRNWENIQPSYKLEIVTKIEIGEYTLCIPKTFWLKLIQRKWKNYYKRKLAKCKNPRNLMKRAIHGKWVF